MNGFSGIEAECEFVGVQLAAEIGPLIAPIERYLERQARFDRWRRLGGQCCRFMVGGMQGAGMMYGAPNVNAQHDVNE